MKPQEKVLNYIKAFFSLVGAVLGAVFLFKRIGSSDDTFNDQLEGQDDILGDRVDELKDQIDNPEIEDLDGQGKEEYWNKELDD